jgi:adenosine deaminase
MPVDARSLQKAELHCHIDGVLDPAMLDELARGGEPLAIDPAALAAHHPVRSVEQWLDGYGALVGPALEPRDRWLPRLLELHLARLRAQNVVYTEILVSSLLFVRSDEAALVDFFAELAARARAAAGPALRVELVICIGRGPPGKLARQVPRISALRRAGLIRGVALAGREAGWPVQPLQPILEGFRDLGLGIEIHAGELAGIESVKDALRHGAPDRLGHAIAAFSDDAVIAEIAERGIHIEFCPSSNLALGVVRRIEEHPIARAHALGLSFSINTDDPGPFACSMTSELALLADTFGFGTADFARIFDRTMQAAFVDR